MENSRFEKMIFQTQRSQRKTQSLFLILLFSFCFGNDSTIVSNPITIVKEYLEKDAKGEFLRKNDWIDSNMVHPERIPGWDISTLIKSYKIIKIEVEDKTSFVNIEYDKIADILQNSEGFYLEPNQKIEKVTFELHKTGKHWKIAKPIQNQHIHPNVINDKLPKQEQMKLIQYLKK